jgi:hypothetical protein
MGFLSKLTGGNKPVEPKITVTVTETTQPTTNKREFSDNDPSLLGDIQTTDTYKPTQSLPYSNICPYCGVVLDKPIGRKKTCPECKKVIYVRTTQDLFPSSALTYEQMNHVDFYMLLKNVLQVTKADYTEHEKMLQKRWNMPKINTYDVLWSMHNDMNLLQRNIDKSMDKQWAITQLFRNCQATSIGAARYQAGRGHDPTTYLKAAMEYSLKMAKLNKGVKGLTVGCYSCCDNCSKFNDKTFSLDFIEKNPVLPIKTCTRPFEDGSKFVFCTCVYRDYYEYE